MEQILDRAQVVCATTTGLDGQLLRDRSFGLVVIDEACQSTEPGSWIPVLRAGKVVLAGDHCQLPPTVVSREAEAAGFSVSMMERLVRRFGDVVTRQLTVQYRMHASIMAFPSVELYGGSLEAAPAVRSHTLRDLPGVGDDALTREPLRFLDTAGAGHDDEHEPDGESRMNREEAALVRRKVTLLLRCGVAPRDIGVITPYSAQVRLLRELIDVPGLEIDTVDGFQGREKEAVVVSMVRSNPDGDIGFLADIRRMNVAMTRARRLLLLVGDGATLASDSFYERLLDHLDREDAHRTVWEESGDGDL